MNDNQIFSLLLLLSFKLWATNFSRFSFTERCFHISLFSLLWTKRFWIRRRVSMSYKNKNTHWHILSMLKDWIVIIIFYSDKSFAYIFLEIVHCLLIRVFQIQVSQWSTENIDDELKSTSKVITIRTSPEIFLRIHVINMWIFCDT